uniref:Uncharacterized protein n=1 Tax=Kwoniella dejecticola CBS 10117 TaxID=1296121 RepID=A0A1A6A309_9TREE|nr:uncharacterized protein I303_05305 [Kwoniella dejecticola CBS 10117]OBR84447.1 hypothetical protein I303_05305 [Kwoniella dejecticola CBS 10117]
MCLTSTALVPTTPRFRFPCSQIRVLPATRLGADGDRMQPENLSGAKLGKNPPKHDLGDRHRRVVSTTEQREIFEATIPAHWDEPFAFAFERVHNKRHPGHHGDPFQYQYIVEIPGGGMVDIPPDFVSPTEAYLIMPYELPHCLRNSINLSLIGPRCSLAVDRAIAN